MTFSVIMPVYGVEKYLATAIECVLAQSFMDFELILVDDCSPDACPRICDQYARKDPRVRVIHKPQNEGLGEARNTGLAAAVGRYVFFMDSDDFISRELLKKAYAAAEDTAQIVVFGFISQYENKEGVTTWAEAVTPPAMRIISEEGMGQAFVRLSRARVFQYAWNKIYRRDFLLSTGVTFERTKLIEDFLFNIAVFEQADTVCTIPNTLYYYRHPTHETLATKYSPDFFELSKRKYTLEKTFIRKKNANSPENRQFVMENYVKHLLSTFIRNRAANARLSFRKQLSFIRAALNDGMTKAVLYVFRPAGKLRLICYIFRKRYVFLSWILAWLGATAQKMKTAVKRGF